MVLSHFVEDNKIYYGSQSFCVGYKANLNHEGHEDHEGDVNRK